MDEYTFNKISNLLSFSEYKWFLNSDRLIRYEIGLSHNVFIHQILALGIFKYSYFILLNSFNINKNKKTFLSFNHLNNTRHTIWKIKLNTLLVLNIFILFFYKSG